MRIFGSLVIGTALLLGLCGKATAATTLTTAALGAADGSRLLCIVANLDKKPITVKIDIIDPFNGTVLAVVDCAGSVAVSGACFGATGTSGFKNGYCRVTSSSGKIKGAFWVQDAAGNTVSVLPATK
jgi:hypothetical protein